MKLKRKKIFFLISCYMYVLSNHAKYREHSKLIFIYTTFIPIYNKLNVIFHQNSMLLQNI